MKWANGGMEGPTRTLPLLPLQPHVLLPGGVLTVALRHDSPLISHLLRNSSKHALIAAVPYSPEASEAGSVDSSQDSEPALDLDRLYHVGVAARVVQMLKSSKVWQPAGAGSPVGVLPGVGFSGPTPGDTWTELGFRAEPARLAGRVPCFSGRLSSQVQPHACD